MEIKRSSINIGEVFKHELISYRSIRKIIFTVDELNNIGIDLINNNMSYQFSHSRKNPFYICQCLELNKILINLGYPEVLNDEQLYKLLNEDFYTAIIESGAYHRLQQSVGEDCFDIKLYKNNIHYAMNEFIVRDEEIEKKGKLLFKKRGN